MSKRGLVSIVSAALGVVACGSDTQSPFSAREADSGASSGGASNSAGGSSAGGNDDASAPGGGAGGGGPNGGAAGGGGPSGGAPGNGGASNGGSAGNGGAAAGGAGGASNGAVDLYVLFDETTSMLCSTPTGTRSQNAMDGFVAFLESPAENGVGIGIQYWMIGGFSPSCTPSDYATPAVEIAPLPGARGTIETSLAAQTAGSMTGPGPVLQGGVDHAAAWATAHPGRTVAVVLVADGTLASACTSTDPVAVANAAFMGTPPIRTYVLGLVDGSAACSFDPSQASAADFDPIALAGGTNAAYVANLATNGAQGVTDAFAAIAAAASR